MFKERTLAMFTDATTYLHDAVNGKQEATEARVHAAHSILENSYRIDEVFNAQDRAEKKARKKAEAADVPE